MSEEELLVRLLRKITPERLNSAIVAAARVDADAEREKLTQSAAESTEFMEWIRLIVDESSGIGQAIATAMSLGIEIGLILGSQPDC
jgi:hypothetical protein